MHKTEWNITFFRRQLFLNSFLFVWTIWLLPVLVYHIVMVYNVNITDITIVLKDILASLRLSLVSFRLSHETEDTKEDDVT